MQLTGLRAWQWMIIGTLAGAAVGFAWTNMPNDITRTGDIRQFRALVNGAQNAGARKQEPRIRNIVVHEPERDPSDVLVYPVTFEYQPANNRGLLARIQQAAKNGGKPEAPPEPTWVTSGIYAATPFDKEKSIVDYLRDSKVSFADRSGSGKYVPVYYGAAAGLGVIGLAWPAAIGLLIKGGFVPAPPPRPKTEKKPKFKSAGPEKPVLKPGATAADAASLHALNDAMEANLAATLAPGAGHDGKPAPAEYESALLAGSASRNATDPTAAAVPAAPEDPKDYKGEYYPVARPHAKQE